MPSRSGPRVYTAHPELKGQRSEAPAVGGGELAAMVPDEGTALVEFSVTPEAIFVFVVTAGDPLVTTVHRLAQSPDGVAAAGRRLRRGAGGPRSWLPDFGAGRVARDAGPVRSPPARPHEAGRRSRRTRLEPAVSGADAERRPLRRAAVLGDLCHVADGAARAACPRRPPGRSPAFGRRIRRSAAHTRHGRWEQRHQGRRAGAAAGCRA